MGSTEGNEVVEGEVVGGGEDEEERRKRGLGWERGMGRGSEQVECASAFAEFRVVGLGLGLGLGLEDGLGIQRVVLFHRVDSEQEHASPGFSNSTVVFLFIGICV